MPAYPFIAVFVAQYILYLTEYKVKINRIFAFIVGIVACIVALVVLLTVTTHWVNPAELVSSYAKNAAWAAHLPEIWQSARFSLFLSIVLLILLIYSIYVLFKSFRKKLYLKTLYAVFSVYLCLLLVMDGVIFPAYKDAISNRPVAKSIKAHYPITDSNLFVMNNLLEYSNMYGLNFYLHNHFRNFEKEMPVEGYFITGNESFEKVLKKYDAAYQFDLLEKYPNYNRDGEQIIQLYYFKKK